MDKKPQKWTTKHYLPGLTAAKRKLCPVA